MAIVSHDLTASQVETLIGKLGGADSALRILAGEFDVQLLPTARGEAPAPQRITVPAGIDFDERVARGRFGWRNPDLTEQLFPVTRDQPGEREQKLFHFNRSLSSEDAARLICEAGYEPARIADVLAFGAAFPDTQRRHPVVGLGSPADVDGKGSVPSLWFDGDRRTLDLIWLDGDWHRNYRFLGVRRVAG